LIVEATPMMYEDDWIDVHLNYYEEGATGRRRLSGGSISTAHARQSDGSLATGGSSELQQPSARSESASPSGALIDWKSSHVICPGRLPAKRLLDRAWRGRSVVPGLRRVATIRAAVDRTFEQ
ncbi:MAG TPA: hypothetical protein VIU34_26540, partial [Steroidobacter sp.]